MRALGARLSVSPAAIYNHFENQSAVVQAAVSLVWEESITAFRRRSWTRSANRGIRSSS